MNIVNLISYVCMAQQMKYFIRNPLRTLRNTLPQYPKMYDTDNFFDYLKVGGVVLYVLSHYFPIIDNTVSILLLACYFLCFCGWSVWARCVWIDISLVLFYISLSWASLVE